MTVRINMWSGPRNISTASMRAWENRKDTVVVDEPLYAAYLARSGVDHPGRAQILASQPSDLGDAVASFAGPLPAGKQVQYVKHMAHHLPLEADLAWTRAFRNALLIRDPGEVVASYVLARKQCTPEDIGLTHQWALYQRFAAIGVAPPVIDAAAFLKSPEAHLRWLCNWAGVEFMNTMLNWPAGPRSTDGVWATYWYGAVLASTTFQPWRPRELSLSPEQRLVADSCRDVYRELRNLTFTP
jgi:hypothetical protein